MQLAALDTATNIEDIDIPGHKLQGSQKSRWSISVNGNWRVTFGLSCHYLAKNLDVAASTLNRIIKIQSGISPEMALRLSKSLGRTPESWLAMQDNYDLWQARKRLQLSSVHKLDLNAA